MYTVDPSAISLKKRLLARLYNACRFQHLTQFYSRYATPYLLAVNYHSTPPATVNSFQKQLRWFAKHYENIDKEKLALFLDGQWTPGKPGLMIHFDDGFLNNATVAAPLLQEYGFTGWFQVVADFLDQPEIAGYPTMSWGDAAELLKKGHEVCSHSSTHKRLTSDLTDEEMEYEVIGSYHKLKDRLGVPPLAFCYPVGAKGDYNSRAVRMVKAHYKYAFPTYGGLITSATSPYALTRCHIESGWSHEHIILSTSYLWRLKHRGTKNEYLSKISSL
jgi:peptidoglycan/xylan/chitin deacetylase (PgdA/CDA1 family)